METAGIIAGLALVGVVLVVDQVKAAAQLKTARARSPKRTSPRR